MPDRLSPVLMKSHVQPTVVVGRQGKWAALGSGHECASNAADSAEIGHLVETLKAHHGQPLLHSSILMVNATDWRPLM